MFIDNGSGGLTIVGINWFIGNDGTNDLNGQSYLVITTAKSKTLSTPTRYGNATLCAPHGSGNRGSGHLARVIDPCMVLGEGLEPSRLAAQA